MVGSRPDFLHPESAFLDRHYLGLEDSSGPGAEERAAPWLASHREGSLRTGGSIQSGADRGGSCCCRGSFQPCRIAGPPFVSSKQSGCTAGCPSPSPPTD